MKTFFYIICLVVISTNFSFSQEKSDFIIHKQVFAPFDISYEMEVEFEYKINIYTTDYGTKCVGLDMRIKELKIMSVKVKDKNLKGNYPYLITDTKLNVSVLDQYKNTSNNKTYSDIYKRMYGMTNSFFGNYYKGGFDNVYKTLGKCEIDDLEINFLDIQIDGFTSEQFDNILKKIEKAN